MRIFPVADPYVLCANGAFFLYAAGAENGVFTVRVSKDLIHWSAEKEIFRAAPDAWSLNCYWAPECHVIDGRYCLFFSANQRNNPEHEDETFRIAVAVCDTPDGRFIDLNNRPLFDPGYPIIDGTILCEYYVDANGRCVLDRRFNADDWKISYYKKNWREKLPENEVICVNGAPFVHWYSCISDYVL